MRKSVLVLSAAAALLVAGCGSSKPELHLFTWQDYVDPELVERFEKENGCRVVIDIFDSNESMLAKIEAGASGYDILFPSSYMVSKLGRDGRLEELDKSRLPNAANIDPAYLACALDPDMRYGIPYMVTYTGIAYRDDLEPLKSAPPEHSWSVFEKRTDLSGRTTILNDMRETLGAALRANGFKGNSTDPEQLAIARDTVIRWKQNIAKFENEQYKTGVASGEFFLVHGYSGDIGQVQTDEGGEHVQFFLPDEGFMITCDEMVVPKTAPNKDLAYRFIDFIHQPDVAAQNMLYTTYWCPNIPAKAIVQESEPEMAARETLFIPAETLKRGEVIDDLGEGLALYTKVWDEILAAGK